MSIALLEPKMPKHAKVPLEQTDYRAFDLTPKKAEKFLALNNFAYQRPIKPRILEAIKEAFINNTWHGNTICIAEIDFDFVVTDENGNEIQVEEILVNGQHTCLAAVQTEISSKNTFAAYRCSSQEELAELFNTFDNPIHNRSVEDQCRTFADTFPDEGWNASKINKCSVAAAVVCLGVNYRGKTYAPDRVHILKDKKYYPHALWVRQLIFDRGQRAGHLAKATSVMSTMLQTHQINANEAETFWEGVRTGQELNAGPQLELYKLLQRASVGNTAGKAGVEILRDFALKIRCHQAWNAYRSSKKNFRFGKLPEELPPLV